MAARAATALLGGYAAAAGLAALAARTLPLARAEATAWGLVASFGLHAGMGLWAFHEARLARVAGGIWGLALLSGGAVWLLGPRP
jgi:hypothetical protein